MRARPKSASLRIPDSTVSACRPCIFNRCAAAGVLSTRKMDSEVFALSDVDIALTSSSLLIRLPICRTPQVAVTMGLHPPPQWRLREQTGAIEITTPSAGGKVPVRTCSRRSAALLIRCEGCSRRHLPYKAARAWPPLAIIVRRDGVNCPTSLRQPITCAQSARPGRCVGESSGNEDTFKKSGLLSAKSPGLQQLRAVRRSIRATTVSGRLGV